MLQIGNARGRGKCLRGTWARGAAHNRGIEFFEFIEIARISGKDLPRACGALPYARYQMVQIRLVELDIHSNCQF